MILGDAETITQVLASWLQRMSAIASVDLVTFDHVRPQSDVGYDSALSPALTRVATDALEEMQLDRLSFWDQVLIRLISEGEQLEPYLEEMLAHNPPLHFSTVKRDAFNAPTVQSSIVGQTGIVGISSRVTMTDGSHRHIPMLDFHCSKSPTNQKNAIRIASTIGGDGYLLDSGKSYHFLGGSLLSTEQMWSALGRALLFSPYVDRVWIAHQLIQGICVLRISSKRGMVPTVICRIE